MPGRAAGALPDADVEAPLRDLDPSGPAGSLSTAIRAVALSSDLESALEKILGLATHDLGADRGLIVVGNGERRQRHVLRSIGLSEDDVAIVESAAGPGDPLAVAAAGQRSMESIGPEGGSPGGSVSDSLAARLGLVRFGAMPLLVARGGIEQVVGVLGVGWTAAAPDEPDAPPTQGTPGFVDALADLAALAIDRAHLASGMSERAEWMERLAHIDPLTGLANRRTFDRVLELEVARASRQQSEVAVAVFDVDAFREANEVAGHEAGDDILRAVAAVLAEQVRLVDTVARIGGDEFIVVAPGSGGVAVAERVVRAIQALPPVGARPISVSAGVARFPADGGSADELLAGALDALELARAGGKGAIASVPAAG